MPDSAFKSVKAKSSPIVRFAGIFALSLFALFAITLSSCKEETSLIGAQYFSDTITVRTVTVKDSSFFGFANYSFSTVTTAAQTFNANYASSSIFIGKVSDANENAESWGVFKFVVLGLDSLAHVDSAQLQLKLLPYRFGDIGNTHIEFTVYPETGGKIDNATTTLATTDLGATPLGHFVGDLPSDSSITITINLDTAQLKKYDPLKLALVVVPGAMTNVRAVGTSEVATAGFAPQLLYTVDYSGTITEVSHPAYLDYHLFNDKSAALPGEFTIRGSANRRESVSINLANLNKTIDSIGKYTTVNNAFLVLKIDSLHSRHSDNVSDTLGPSVIQLRAANATLDSTGVLVSYGTRDPSDPSLYKFQIRRMIELWQRDPTQNFGFELRTGDIIRGFLGYSVSVEDYTLNRWTFYGIDAADPNNRPKLVLTYSRF